MKSILFIITLSLLSCTLNAGEWVNMFDGKTLDGWKVNTENPKTFSVVDGTIKVFVLAETLVLGNRHVDQRTGAGAGTDASRPPSDLVALLGSGGMDWGSIMVFSCEDSCDGSQEEFCVVVDPLA